MADLNNDGHLTRDGFAIAMHLIQGKLTGKDIPGTLPPSLVPPSMRATIQGASPFIASAPAAVPPAAEPIRDLLWDDSPPASATASQHPIPKVSSPPVAQATPVLQTHGTGHMSPNMFGVRSPPAPSDPFGTSAFGPPGKTTTFLSQTTAKLNSLSYII